MREIEFNEIVEKVSYLCMEANYRIGKDVLEALKKAKEEEESPVGRYILDIIIKNNEVANEENMPICQDTGFAVFFVDVGEEVRIKGGSLRDAIFEGVRKGYKEGYLRKSIVDDPVFDRKNTKDNTPPIIHWRIVPGDRIHIVFAPKGGGSENMSEIRMLTPAQGIEGVKNFVLERVEKSGGNPCPPIIVGVGIGGTFEYAAILAKRAILRPIGSKNTDPRYAEVEEELLERINRLGIGPMGLGGRTTALAVHIETFPCHIASLPCAVNIQCHAARHKEITI